MLIDVEKVHSHWMQLDVKVFSLPSFCPILLIQELFMCIHKNMDNKIKNLKKPSEFLSSFKETKQKMKVQEM